MLQLLPSTGAASCHGCLHLLWPLTICYPTADHRILFHLVLYTPSSTAQNAQSEFQSCTHGSEENNRIGKTRDLLKKIRDNKGIRHAKMGLIKDRNGMDLTEAEDIKKRWQEYREGLNKKELHNPDNHNGVITYLEPDILECEVKWALESITTDKAKGGDGIPV